ncbi:Tyrosine-protein kinase abl1 [Balamuthia mandrillaris]
MLLQRLSLCVVFALIVVIRIPTTEGKQKPQWGNYLVTEEKQLKLPQKIGDAFCLLPSFVKSELHLGIGGDSTVSDVFFDTNGKTKSWVDFSHQEGSLTIGDAVVPLTDLNGDGTLKVAFNAGLNRIYQKKVLLGVYSNETFSNTTIIRTFALNEPPLSRFPIFQQRYDVNAPETDAYFFGTSITFVGDVDKNGVGDIAINAEHRFNSYASTFHILFLDKSLDVVNVSTITLLPDTFAFAFASVTQLGFTPKTFADTIAGIGDLDGDNTPDMAATAVSDDDRIFMLVLFLTPGGTVKDFRVHSSQAFHNPPGSGLNADIWSTVHMKSMGYEAALTETERFSSADFNNDHYPDLVIASAQHGDTWIVFLDGSGNITGNTFYATTDTSDSSGVVVVDTNDDSIPDLVLASAYREDRPTIKFLLMDAIRVTVTSASFAEAEEDEEEKQSSKAQTRTLVVTFQVELSARPRYDIQVDFEVQRSEDIAENDVVVLTNSPLIFDGQTPKIVQMSVVLPAEGSDDTKRNQVDPSITLVLKNAVNGLVNSSNSFLLSLTSSEESNSEDSGNKEDSNDDQTQVIVPIVVTLVVVVLAVIVGIGVWWRRRQVHLVKRRQEMELESQYGVFETGGGNKHENKKNYEDEERTEDHWEIAYDELTFIKKIGEGAFGEVWKGMWRLSEVAIKKLHTMDESQLRDFQMEAQTLKCLRPHGNVIRLLGIVNEEHRPFCIVTEFMKQGDLNSYLTKHKDSIESETMLKWAIDIASGMHHLHSEGITHRDLATRNLLLTNTLRIKVADFGMSRQMENKGGAQKTTNEVGPLKWMAPEAIEDHVYSEKSDVWSFGVCLWEIASFGAVPYAGLSPVNAAMRVCQQQELLEPPTETLPVLRQVMQSCWAFSPDERPTFADILQALTEK